MNITGKWKIKEFHLPSESGEVVFTPETLPDTEEYEDFAKMVSTRIEFTSDGLMNTLMPAPGELAEMARQQGLTVRDDGFAVIESKPIKEQDGKYFIDTEIEGEFLGESVDSMEEIKVTPDGCLLYSFDMLLLERE